MWSFKGIRSPPPLVIIKGLALPLLSIQASNKPRSRQMLDKLQAILTRFGAAQEIWIPSSLQIWTKTTILILDRREGVTHSCLNLSARLEGLTHCWSIRSTGCRTAVQREGLGKQWHSIFYIALLSHPSWELRVAIFCCSKYKEKTRMED